MLTRARTTVPGTPWYITRPDNDRFHFCLSAVSWPLLSMALLFAVQYCPPFVVSAHAYVDTAPQGFRFRNGITAETHPSTIPACSPGGVYTQQYQGEYQNLLPSSKTQYDNNQGNQIGICFGGISDSEYMYVDRYCPDGVVRFHVNGAYYACRYFEDCPENHTRNAVTGQCELSLKNQSATDCGISTSHPINVGTGGKWLLERDRAAGREHGLEFSRYYNYYRAAGDSDSPMGVNWRHSYQRSLDLSSGLSLQARRADGKVYRFTYSAVYWREDGSGYDYGEPRWLSEDDVEDRLIRLDATHPVPNGWQYTTASNVTELYDAGGRLVSITSVDGYTRTLSYAANGRLERVDTPTGEFLLFAYDGNGRISGVTDQAGRSWGYRYDAVGNLSFVDNPDLTSRRYHYNEAALTGNSDLVHALTGITDERALSDQPHERYATFGYDVEGRAVLSTLAADVDRVDIQYAADGVRSVRNSNAVVSTYSTDFHLGQARLGQVSGSGCSACGVQGDAAYEYDGVNNLIGRSDNGTKTLYGDYDGKGQYGCKVEGVSAADTTPNTGNCAFDPVASPEARRIDDSYDARFYNRITSITEPSVYGSGNKITTYTYDDYGNRLSATINGFQPDGTPVSRTTTWQYTGPLNQLSFMDGPRTDVDDFTTYRYYPNDPAEGNNRARLKEVEDAHGVLIRRNIQYSATGKVLSELRPNGLTLSYSYYPGNDRLETLTESDGTTSRVSKWTYLATGEVQTITTGFGTPDATTLTFGYDDARRLTRITDGLGNYIEYTLDTEGNRKEEKTHDSGGVLKKQLSQTFDVYNRLDNNAQANESTNHDFAPNGTLDKSTDGKGSVTDYSYDALKRLTQVTQDLGGNDPTTADATTVYG
jgi:YD repeat-containing protein